MEWLGVDKSQNRTKFDGEVVVSYENHGKNTRVVFKFRKNSIHKIAVDCKHVVIAKEGDCVYFKEADSKHGFTVGNYAVDTTVFKVRYDRFPVPEENLGEYELEFDSKTGLQYICFRRKLEAPSLRWEGK